MSAIEAFQFEGAAVRVVVGEDGEPRFVAVDVCGALGLGNPRSSLALLDDDEKGVHSIDTPGGPQEMTTVTEGGMYSLVLRSRKPEAKRFKRWLTSEVLPAIRKTGGYGSSAAALNDPTQLRALLLGYAEKTIALEQKVEAMAPKVDFADALLNADGTTLVRDVAKTIGARVRKLEKALRTKGVILANGAPAAVYVEKGYFVEVTHAYETKTAGTRIGHTARVTGRGIEFIRRFCRRHADMVGAAQ